MSRTPNIYYYGIGGQFITTAKGIMLGMQSYDKQFASSYNVRKNGVCMIYTKNYVGIVSRLL